MKSEVLVHILVSAKSDEVKKVDSNPKQEYELDFKHQLRSVVPLLKLGIGYNLILTKRLNVNAGIYLDIRGSSYFYRFERI